MTPTKQEMLEKIYNKIADKTLSFGCKVLHKPDIGVCYDVKYMYTGGKYDNRPYNVDEIIGHPVMIGDVLDYFTDDNMHSILGSTNESDILYKRLYKRKPIDDQSDECIIFIYNLINNDTN